MPQVSLCLSDCADLLGQALRVLLKLLLDLLDITSLLLIVTILRHNKILVLVLASLPEHSNFKLQNSVVLLVVVLLIQVVSNSRVSFGDDSNEQVEHHQGDEQTRNQEERVREQVLPVVHFAKITKHDKVLALESFCEIVHGHVLSVPDYSREGES